MLLLLLLVVVVVLFALLTLKSTFYKWMRRPVCCLVQKKIDFCISRTRRHPHAHFFFYSFSDFAWPRPCRQQPPQQQQRRHHACRPWPRDRALLVTLTKAIRSSCSMWASEPRPRSMPSTRIPRRRSRTRASVLR